MIEYYQKFLNDLYEKYKKHASYEVSELIPCYKHNYVDYDKQEVVFWIHDENHKKAHCYTLLFRFLEEQDLEMALLGCCRCKTSIITPQFGEIPVSVRANPNYTSEIIIGDRRVELPSNLSIGDIKFMVFYGSFDVAKVVLQNDTTMWCNFITTSYTPICRIIN